MSGRKTEYLELVDAYRTNGWRACCEQIEVGCKISMAISAPDIQAPWYERFTGEKSHQKHQQGSRKSFKLAMDQEGPSMV